tara:strand:+ start:137 stop:1030 length:894 start_codon:yes stop_codon:yes gene_type:complete
MPAAGPAPQPVNPTVPAGGVLYASGAITTPVSGVSGTGFFNGPWTITTQYMNITYNRVPKLSVTGVELDLDSGRMTHRVDSTQIACIVNAGVSITSSTDAYPTSGMIQQSQKFEIVPVSADHTGASYGDLTASTLGPRGHIVTQIPFYQRRLKQAGDDDLYTTSTITGANFLYGTSSTVGSVNDVVMLSQYEGLTDYEAFAMPFGARGSFLNAEYHTGDNIGHVHFYFDTYDLGGGYATNQEYLMGIINMVNRLGETVRDVLLEQVPGAGPWHSSPWYFKERFIGIQYYDPNRHDWT